MSDHPVTVADHLQNMPTAVRPVVRAARRTVKAIAPKAEEIGYQSQPPRSNRAMWKIVRYAVDGVNVVGIGIFPTYATIFFYRGRELDDGRGLLEGSGEDSRFLRLRAPADVDRPAVTRLVRKAFKLAGVSSRP